MAKSKAAIKKENRNKMFAAMGIIVAIVVAFLIAAYVSNNKDVDKPNYGELVVHPTTAKTDKTQQSTPKRP